MGELFRNMLNVSFQGGIVIAVVLLVRLALNKAPKKYVCLLWVLVGVRLLMPFDIQSMWSLQPNVVPITQAGTAAVPTQMQEPSHIPAVPGDAALPKDTEVVYGDAFADFAPDSAAADEILRVVDYAAVAAWVWLAVACGMGAYSAVSYMRLKHRVRNGAVLSEGVWECPGIDTAFILGYLRPRIYLPVGLAESDRELILTHERVHLKRGDHWVKLIGFAALAVHWFNPLVWVGYIMLCRDIEMACDESVVKDMDLQGRKAYSAALLSCSANHQSLAVCPVAFGEVSVKQRILSVLNYRKPRFWLTVLAVAAIVFVAVCFLTSPAAGEPDLSFLNYENAVPLVAEQDVLVAVHYTGEEEESSIGIGMAEGEALARYLDSAQWTEKWFKPSDRSSPGSVAFNITDDYRITVYDRRFAAVEFDGEVRYYRIGRDDYAAAVDMVLPVDQKRLQREFDIYLGTATLEVPYWGITLSAADITPTGLTAIFAPTTGEMTDNLTFLPERFVERLSGDEWVEVEVLDQEKKQLWNWGKIYTTPDESFKVRIEWEEIYGVLPAGTYRLGQMVMMNDNGLGWGHTYYVEFEISDASENIATEES